MNTETLHLALQQSFSADKNLRVPAEETIKNLKHVDGATIMLLQVAAERQVVYEVRLAAAIQLKNICRQCWSESYSYTGIPLHAIADDSGEKVLLKEQDKAALRISLVEALLLEQEKAIRDMLAETIYSIVPHDFPDNWPNLFPAILEAIKQSDDPTKALQVHNALLALRKICKRFEYKRQEQRGPLNVIVAQSFPLLLPLAQRLSAPDQNSLEAAMTLKQILKIFWSSTQFYLPEHCDGTTNSVLANPLIMQPWFEIIQATLAKPLPEANSGLEPRDQPTTVEDRNAWPWWKLKKWSVQIMCRHFTRYGVPHYAEESVQLYSKYFSQNVAPNFLRTVCETLNLKPSGQFCTDRVLHLCLTFVDHAVELAATYKMIKPHMDFLLFQVCFPTMCLTQDDIETFENDPHDFVHKWNSPMADLYDPAMSAINLLMDLVKHRGRDVLGPLMDFLMNILQRYSTADDASKNHVEKDGCLLAIGSLCDTLSKKKYNADIENIMVNSVFPEFKSPISFLRSRACWMVQRYYEIEWSDDGTRLQTLFQMVLERLSDPALPVQIEASKALRFLIDKSGSEQILLPVLPQILNEYFRIMTEIGNDEVVAALQVIIDHFGDHIEPHASALITHLCTAFSNYCSVGEEDDDAAVAAGQCLECISTVLKGICERPDLFKALEPQILPVIAKIFAAHGEYVEYIEYALDILTFLTYFPDDISPGLWETIPLMYVAFDKWAFDNLNLMVPPIDNLMQKDPQKFFSLTANIDQSTISYIDLVFNMVQKVVVEARSAEIEVRTALGLYISILTNCRGSVDNYLPVINDIVLAKLQQQTDEQKPQTRIAIYQVLGCALHYNAALELAELERRGVTADLFNKWISDIDHMEKWLALKTTALGFASTLQLPTSSLPASFVNLLPQIITSAARVATKMLEEEGKGEEEDDFDDGANFEGGEEQDEDGGFGEDEDVYDSANDVYLNAVKNLRSTNDVMQFLMGDEWGDDDDDDDYTGPLDEIDSIIFFSDTLKAANEREPQAYQQIQGALPPDVMTCCNQLFTAADVRRKEAAQAQ